MAYDENLETGIQSAIGGWKGVSAKKIFGGVCHLIHGNMFCGVYKEFLILRLGEAEAAEALTAWMQKAREFALTLPPKE